MSGTSYAEVLELALAALRSGEDLETVLARYPEYAEALRRDLALADTVAELASVVPPPQDAVRRNAEARLHSQLQQTAARRRDSRELQRRLTGSTLPRIALAAAVAAIAALAFVLLSGNDGATVQAAMIEGVVLENSGESLTIQTLDATEHVAVPADALIAGDAGDSIPLRGINVGEVVVVNLQRSQDGAVARQVRRLAASIDAWCSGQAERCAALAERLERAARDCDNRPGACQALLDQTLDLRDRALAVAALEGLKARCRTGDRAACRELLAGCSRDGSLCTDVTRPQPAPSATPTPRDGTAVDSDLLYRAFYESCHRGDETTCRQLIAFCREQPRVCPDQVPTPTPTPPPATDLTRPAPTPSPTTAPPQPTARPASDRPAPTATPPQRPAPTATPAGDPLPTATPVPDVPSRDVTPIQQPAQDNAEPVQDAPLTRR